MAKSQKNSKNPIDDIAQTVGGWLGGSAKSLNTLLTGDKNPTLNPQTRRGIRTTQQALDLASGGGVSAAQQGPGALQRYANTQIALYGAGMAAPSAIGAALQSGPGQYATRKAANIAANAAFHARLLKPVTTRTAMRAQAKLHNQLQEAQDVADDTWHRNRQLEAEVQALRKGKEYDEDYAELYQRYSPVYRATQEAVEAINDPLLSQGRRNRMLMDTAYSAYEGISKDWNAEEIRFAKRALRERGKYLRQYNEWATDFDRRSYERASQAAKKRLDERRAAERAKKLQRLFDLSNAKRNMPRIDPDDLRQ